MIRHDSLDEVQETAALYALGALDPEHTRAFEAHLAGGCDQCAAEVETFRRVAADLAQSGPAAAPRADVRARVLAEAGTDPAVARITKPGLVFVRTGLTEWLQPGLPGIELKLLALDEVRGRSTQLVRMMPGAMYPPHRHGGTEELLLLEGDLLVSGVEMGQGDYCRAEPDSVHDNISTRSGCTFIATSSIHDEVLA